MPREEHHIVALLQQLVDVGAVAEALEMTVALGRLLQCFKMRTCSGKQYLDVVAQLSFQLLHNLQLSFLPVDSCRIEYLHHASPIRLVGRRVDVVHTVVYLVDMLHRHAEEVMQVPYSLVGDSHHRLGHDGHPAMVAEHVVVDIHQLDVLAEHMVEQPEERQEFAFMQHHDAVAEHKGIPEPHIFLLPDAQILMYFAKRNSSHNLCVILPLKGMMHIHQYFLHARHLVQLGVEREDFAFHS